MNTHRFPVAASAAFLLLGMSLGHAVLAQPPRQERPSEAPPAQQAPNRQPGQPGQAQQPGQAAQPGQPEQPGQFGQFEQEQPAPGVRLAQPGPAPSFGVVTGPGAPGTAPRPGFFVPATVATAPNGPPVANVELADVVSRVAAATGKRFFIDSRTPSRIYVNEPALDNLTYPLFLVALDANGLAAAEIEGTVLIVPVDEARQLPSRIVQNDDAAIPDDEWVTRILTIQGRQASGLVPILRPLLPRAAHLAAFVGAEGTAESKLVIVDRYANVRRVTELVKALTE